MDAQLADFERVPALEAHDLVLVKEHLAVVDQSADLAFFHSGKGNRLSARVMEGPLGGQLLDAGKALMVEGNRLVLFRVVEDDLPAADGLQAGDGLQQLLLPAAGDPGDAEDFPAVGGKGNVLEDMDALAVVHVEAVDHQPGGRVLGGAALDVEVHLLADHHLGQLRLVRMGRLHRGDMDAAAQDGDPVADLEHLVELMGDDDDGLAVPPHHPQNVEEPVDLLRGQHGRGLVQDQDVRPAVEDLDDLHRLLFGDRHVVNLFFGVDMETVAVRDGADAGVDFPEVVLAFLVYAQDDVFRRGKQVHKLKVLVNHADLVVKGVLGGADDHLLPVDQDGAFVGVVDAGDHVHQGRFAAAVFAQDGEDFSPVNVQVHVVVGDDAAECLGDAAHFKRKLLFHRFSSEKKV